MIRHLAFEEKLIWVSIPYKIYEKPNILQGRKSYYLPNVKDVICYILRNLKRFSADSNFNIYLFQTLTSIFFIIFLDWKIHQIF